MYSGAARAPRHGGGIVKIFHWEGEPQREFDTATTTPLRTFQLIIRTTASTSVAPPSSRTADNTVLLSTRMGPGYSVLVLTDDDSLPCM